MEPGAEPGPARVSIQELIPVADPSRPVRMPDPATVPEPVVTFEPATVPDPATVQASATAPKPSKVSRLPEPDVLADLTSAEKERAEFGLKVLYEHADAEVEYVAAPLPWL